MKIQAVKTTGIYCRADCGARPNPENVQPMRNSIAAMARGFRPCLVCRPDRLPEIGLDNTAPEIAQAVRLIAEGFLDDANTDQLARRVGYSSRHLVRLFEKHIGASPDFVARARRAHFARRLLDETDLSITNIAFAAGFSSLRQMNRVIVELFGFSPTQLRSKRQRKSLLDPLDGGLRLRIPVNGTPDIPQSIEYLGPRAIPGIEIVEDGCYKRTMNTCGHPGIVEVGVSECGEQLETTMHLASFGSIVDQVERVRSLFGLNVDNSKAIEFLHNDVVLGHLVRENSNLRLPGAWDRFETSIRIIIGQQVSVAGASTLAGRLAARFGHLIDAPMPGSLRYLFPSADDLSKAKFEELGMPQARANTIKHFATAVASGDIDLSACISLDETVATMEQLPGIGPWTSHLIAGRVMRHLDAFPASDLGLRRAVAKLLGRPRPVSAAEMEVLSKDWRPYRFVAAAFLWMVNIEHKRKEELHVEDSHSKPSW